MVVVFVIFNQIVEVCFVFFSAGFPIGERRGSNEALTWRCAYRASKQCLSGMASTRCCFRDEALLDDV